MGSHHSKVTVVKAGGFDLSPTDAPLLNNLRSEYANANQRASGRVAWDLQEYEYRSKQRVSDEILLVDKETTRISHGNISPSGAGALPTCGPSDKRNQGQAAMYPSSTEKACELEAGARAPVFPASAGRTTDDKNFVTPAAPCTQTNSTAAGPGGENSLTAGAVSKQRRPATGNPNHHSNNKQSALKAQMTGSPTAVPPARAACAATAAPATAIAAQNAATNIDIKTCTANVVTHQTDTAGKAAGTAAAPAAAAAGPDSTSAASMAEAAAAAAAAASVQWVIRPGPAIESVYKLGKILGQGSFGVVRAATHIATGAEVAVKTIRKSMLRAADVTSLRREVEILHHLSGHPHISQLLGVYEELRQLHLVLELYKGGDLFDAIIGSGRHSERTAADVLRTVLTAIAYCHAMGVAHRDIKPENFMLTAELPKDFQDKQGPPLPPQQQQQQQQGPGGRLVAPLAPPLIGIGARLKLIDFGLSAFCTDDTPMTDIVGTSYYVAPEVLEGRYGLPADVWSAGVILHIMLTGYAPFDGKDDREILRAVRKGHLDLSKDAIWKSISPEATAVVTAMLDRDPKKRATADQVLSMPWIGRTTDACLAPSTPLPGLVSERMHRFARMSSFKKEARRVVAGLMRPEEVAGLVAQFQGLDADKDGRVNLTELKEGLVRQAALRGGESASTASPLSEDHLRELLRRSDLNGDGLLDESEFLAAALPSAALARHALAAMVAGAGPRPPSRHGQQPSNALAAAFKHFDVDGSGYITLGEMRKALAAHHPTGQSGDVEALLARHDRDADGQISFPEFVDMLVKDIDDDDDDGGLCDVAFHGRPQRQARQTPPVSGNIGAISPSTKCSADGNGSGRGGSDDGRNTAPHSKDNAVAWGTGGFEPCGGGGGGAAAVAVSPGASKGRGDGASATFSRSSTAAAQTAGSRLSALEWMDECSDGAAAAAARHDAVEEAIASKPSDALGMVTTAAAGAAAAAAQAAARRSGNGGAAGIAATSTSAPRIPSRLSHTQVPHIPLQQSSAAPRESAASGGMPRLAIRCGSGGANHRTSVGGYSPSAADAADPGSGALYRLSDVPNFAGGQAVPYGVGGAATAVQTPALPLAHRMTPPRLQLPVQPIADVRSRRHSAGGMMPDGRGLFVVVGGSGAGGAGSSGTGSGAASPLSHGDSRPAAHTVRQIPGGRTTGASIDLGLGYNLNDLQAAARAAVTSGDGCTVSLPGSPSTAAASAAAQRVVAGRISAGSGAGIGPPSAVLQQRPPALQPQQPGPMGMLPALQTQLSNSPGERLSEHASCPQTPLAGWPLSPGGGGAAAAAAATRQNRASATGMFLVRNPPPWAAPVNATLRPAPPSEPLPVLHISGMRSRRQSTGSPALCQVTVSGATAATGVASPQALQAQPHQHMNAHAHAQQHYSVSCNGGGSGCNNNNGNSNSSLTPRVTAPIMSDWASGGASSAGTPTAGRRSRRITQPGILPFGEDLILTSRASMDLDVPMAGAVDDEGMNHHVLPPGATGLGFGAPYRPLMASGSGRLL
ncbi:hypothetical protein VaNZ11_003371 [Volvox africanus]|uniref:Non-specific serine/threonine protein kinase n=1 Tax=Volvox africanus TaxID=51714 RepID=A0ABQ5RUI2_9CHLO|nr:hypothetical protein VaNZ11_003371 [Volvox africanus]